MRNEFTPIVEVPETPPLAPHDPPDPAPQAAAWRRALAVVERLTRPQCARRIG
jgi:hypothetical protein